MDSTILWAASFKLFKPTTKNVHLATIFLRSATKRQPFFFNFEPWIWKSAVIGLCFFPIISADVSGAEGVMNPQECLRGRLLVTWPWIKLNVSWSWYIWEIINCKWSTERHTFIENNSTSASRISTAVLIWVFTSNSWHYSCPRSVYCWSIVFLILL